jgi:hypothetical protein
MFRTYFNRHSDAPNVWSVDMGTQETEINVANVIKKDVPIAFTNYDLDVAGRDKYTPRAVEWIFGAKLELKLDSRGQLTAIFTPAAIFTPNENR